MKPHIFLRAGVWHVKSLSGVYCVSIEFAKACEYARLFCVRVVDV